jgi:G3E family GTPase
MSKKQVPVLLLTGYLGSGKTTLVNRILSNRNGIRFAVIVNDIGEVNIDAALIQKGGVVGTKDDSLVALQNGCICCTLKMDLVQQLTDIVAADKFDYIVIEASGICEPEPIAQTICSIPSLGPQYTEHGVPVLDCIVTVVDALRMQSEFGCGLDLKRKNIDEDDIENLVIQQIEFCNKILLNKASEVTPDELGRVRAIVRELQPKAEIVECDWGDVDLDSLLNTHLFDFESVVTSATWIREVEGHHDEDEDEEDEHDEHGHPHHDHDDDEDDHDEHGHHHHHHHEGGEVEEYGIGTYVYYARKALDINRFDWFVAKRWPKGVIRAKGICYFQDQFDTCYVFEQAGKQISLRNAGLWFGAMPKEELMQQMERDPMLAKDWDPYYGDRMQKLVFIGQHLDKEAIRKALDDCLVDPDTATA